MKTILIIIMLVLCSAGGWADNTGEGFITANDVTYFCNAIKIGSANTWIETTEGDVYKMPSNKVKAYRSNGRQFELMPVLNPRGDTTAMAFMEYITSRKGSRLYCYCSNCCKYDPLSGEIAPINRIYRYYVLKDGKLNLLVNEDEVDNAMDYFNVKIIS